MAGEHPREEVPIRHPALRRIRPGAALRALVAWCILGAAAAGPSAARAQPATGSGGTAGFLVLEAPAGTGAMALGDVPWLFGEDAALLFYTPAGLERVSGVSAALQRYGSEGTLVSIAGAGQWKGGGVALGLRSLRYDRPAGAMPGPDAQGLALAGGDIGVTALAGSIGYGHSVAGAHAGLALGFAEESVGGETARALFVDLGLARDVGPVRVGLAARNLGGDPRPGGEPGDGTEAARLELPTAVALGLSTRSFEAGPLDLFLAAEVARRRDGEVIPAGGVEVSYWPVTGYTFRLRAGLQRVSGDDRSPLTLGAAFTADDFTFEYAWESFDGEGDAHRFGLRWR